MAEAINSGRQAYIDDKQEQEETQKDTLTAEANEVGQHSARARSRVYLFVVWTNVAAVFFMVFF